MVRIPIPSENSSGLTMKTAKTHALADGFTRPALRAGHRPSPALHRRKGAASGRISQRRMKRLWEELP